MREKSFFGSGGFIWKLIFMIAAPQTRENHTASIIEKLCNNTNVFAEQLQEAIVKPIMEKTLHRYIDFSLWAKQSKLP